MKQRYFSSKRSIKFNSLQGVCMKQLRRQNSHLSRESKRQEYLRRRRDRPPASMVNIHRNYSNEEETLHISLLMRIIHGLNKGNELNIEQSCVDLCNAFNQGSLIFRNYAFSEGILRKLALHISSPHSTRALRAVLWAFSSLGEIISRSEVESWPSEDQVKPAILSLCHLIPRVRLVHEEHQIHEIYSYSSNLDLTYYLDACELSRVCQALGVLLRCGCADVCCSDDLELAPALIRLIDTDGMHLEVISSALRTLGGAAGGGDALTLSMLGIPSPKYACVRDSKSSPLLKIIVKFMGRTEEILRCAACSILIGASLTAPRECAQVVCENPKLFSRILHLLSDSKKNCSSDAATILLNLLCNGGKHEIFVLIEAGAISALSELLSANDPQILNLSLTSLEFLMSNNENSPFARSNASLYVPIMIENGVSDQLMRLCSNNTCGTQMRAASLLESIRSFSSNPNGFQFS